MIAAIRTRSAFDQLARHGKRMRRPALWCNWCPDLSTSTTSVAFALSRALGPAVRRNRMRRRLRALLRELEPSLPGGLLLIGANPAAIELTFPQLKAELHRLLAPVLTDTHSAQAATSSA